MDVDWAAIGAASSCLIGSVCCVGGGAGDSVTTEAPVLSENDGVVCCARGWGDENVCAGKVCDVGRGGAEVVDGTDWAGVWLRADTVD